jgi:ppGpp synthetase/RelA/SpoT-type nucleotidyltranferase
MPLSPEARVELYRARIEESRYDEAVDEVIRELTNHIRFSRYISTDEIERRISFRIKNPSRIEAKVDRGKVRAKVIKSLAALEEEVTDIAGVRVVLDRLDQVNAVGEFVAKNGRWVVLKTERKRRADTGYRALHLDVTLDTTNYTGVRCEIQLRTLLQHAYALWTTPMYEYYRMSADTIPGFLLGQMCGISDAMQDIDRRVNRLVHRFKEVLS